MSADSVDVEEQLGISFDADDVLDEHDPAEVVDAEPDLVVVCAECGPWTSYDADARGQATVSARTHANMCQASADAVQVRKRVGEEFVEVVEEVASDA